MKQERGWRRFFRKLLNARTVREVPSEKAGGEQLSKPEKLPVSLSDREDLHETGASYAPQTTPGPSIAVANNGSKIAPLRQTRLAESSDLETRPIKALRSSPSASGFKGPDKPTGFLVSRDAADEPTPQRSADMEKRTAFADVHGLIKRRLEKAEYEPQIQTSSLAEPDEQLPSRFSWGSDDLERSGDVRSTSGQPSRRNSVDLDEFDWTPDLSGRSKTPSLGSSPTVPNNVSPTSSGRNSVISDLLEMYRTLPPSPQSSYITPPPPVLPSNKPLPPLPPRLETQLPGRNEAMSVTVRRASPSIVDTTSSRSASFSSPTSSVSALDPNQRENSRDVSPLSSPIVRRGFDERPRGGRGYNI